MASVAVLADVHGSATALAAVLREVEREGPELVVHCGDLTWGPEPQETLALLEPWRDRLVCVRGNAERMLAELAEGASAAETPRQSWMLERHDAAARELLAGFAPEVVLDVAGLGRVLFCHGSPRSDEECLTVETPEARLREALAGVEADVLVTAHTHMQYDRRVLGRRLLNPGSVGMPYEDERGAYWAMLGPDVSLRCTGYDLAEAVARQRASGDPDAERMIGMLLDPPSRAEVVEDAERRIFAG